jgi:hypothetical protein
MAGRVDKALFITTGTFTAAATREATREGVPHQAGRAGDGGRLILQRHLTAVEAQSMEYHRNPVARRAGGRRSVRTLPPASPSSEGAGVGSFWYLSSYG